VEQETTNGNPISPELIPVRIGEEIDLEKLTAYLEGRLPCAEGAIEILQFAGGHANLTYLLRFPEKEYVLRRPPIGPVAKTAHDMGREHRVLSRLYKAFPLAPRSLLHCEDTAVVGSPFIIMERRDGTVVRKVVPPAYGSGRDPEQNRILSEVLVDTLAALHKVDVASVGLEKIGKPQGYMERQIRGWGDRYDRAKTKEIPFFEDLKGWLMEKMPPSLDATLVHNDWRLDNMMLDPGNPAKVVAVFDWDMCTLGDPLSDLGCMLSFWFEEGEHLAAMTAMPSTVPGFMKRAEAIHRYGEVSGKDVSKVDFYYVFGLYKMAVVVQQIYFRYSRGQTTDERFSLFEVGAELLMSLAWEEARASSL